MKPPTKCIVPIGETILELRLKQSVEAELYASGGRLPSVYRANPFQVEVAMAYGGQIDPEGPVTLMRFANWVPLPYQ